MSSLGHVDLVSADGRAERRIYTEPPQVVAGREITSPVDVEPAPGGLLVGTGLPPPAEIRFVSAATGVVSPVTIGESPALGPGGELAYVVPPMALDGNAVFTNAVLALHDGPNATPVLLADTGQPELPGRGLALSPDGSHLAATIPSGGANILAVYALTQPASANNPRHYVSGASTGYAVWSDPVFLDPAHVAVVATCGNTSCGSEVLEVDLATGSTRKMFQSTLHIDQALYDARGELRYLVALPPWRPPMRLPPVPVHGGVAEIGAFNLGLASLYRVTASKVQIVYKDVFEAVMVPSGWPSEPSGGVPPVSFKPQQPLTGYPVLAHRSIGSYEMYAFGGPSATSGRPVVGTMIYGPEGQVGGSYTNLQGTGVALAVFGGGGSTGLWDEGFEANDPRITTVQLRVDGQIVDSMKPVTVGGVRFGYLLLRTTVPTSTLPEVAGLDSSGRTIAKVPVGIPSCANLPPSGPTPPLCAGHS